MPKASTRKSHRSRRRTCWRPLGAPAEGHPRQVLDVGLLFVDGREQRADRGKQLADHLLQHGQVVGQRCLRGGERRAHTLDTPEQAESFRK